AAPLSHWFGKYAGWLLWTPLAAAAWVLIQAYTSSSGEVVEYYPWIPDFYNVGFHLRLNGLSLLFGLLVLVIGAGVFFYSARYLGKTKIISFYLTMSAFALFMLILVLANDLMVLYVAWEGTTLASFFLIARSGSHSSKHAGHTLLMIVSVRLGLLAVVSVLNGAQNTSVIIKV